jgi:hypothetical protein
VKGESPTGREYHIIVIILDNTENAKITDNPIQIRAFSMECVSMT